MELSMDRYISGYFEFHDVISVSVAKYKNSEIVTKLSISYRPCNKVHTERFIEYGPYDMVQQIRFI